MHYILVDITKKRYVFVSVNLKLVILPCVAFIPNDAFNICISRFNEVLVLRLFIMVTIFGCHL